jgi:sulfur carrier protein ThiS
LKVQLRAAGTLAGLIDAGEDHTRSVEARDGATIKEILASLGIQERRVAFVFTDGKLEKLGYRPSDGEVVTLQPPISGG